MANQQSYQQLNGLTLAYVGDAVYELYVRKYLVETGKENPDELHKSAVTYVSAKAQADVIWHWRNNEILTEEEERILKRGRNAKSRSTPKNTSIHVYRYSTGFEALIGYHYLLQNVDRLEELLSLAVSFINRKES